VKIKHLKLLSRKFRIIRIILFPFILARRISLRKSERNMRSLVDNLSLKLVNHPALYVPEFEGVFSMSARSDIFFRIVSEGSYESEFACLCKKYIDRAKDAIDIGANIGFYTILFAKTIENKRKVLSIEPTRNALRHLYSNIKENCVSEKVIVYEGAASDRTGFLEIKTIKDKEEYSTLGLAFHPSVKTTGYEKEVIRTSTIDDLVGNLNIEPGFIKIDVEGAEYLVIKGARNVIKEFRPVILSEFSDYLLKGNRTSAKELIDLIESLDYQIYDPLTGSKKIVRERFGDIICFPKESKIRIKS